MYFSTLPPELVQAVVTWTDPTSSRNLRACNRAIKETITPRDLVWAEGVWRLYYRDFDNCWDWAARNGHVEIVRRLLPKASKHNKAVLLAICAKRGHTELLEFALDTYGTNSRFLTSLLVRASHYGQAHTVKLLLAHGADLHQNFDEPLRVAAGRGHMEVVNILLDAGANMKDARALLAATKGGHASVLEELLQLVPEQYLVDGDLLLYKAVKGGHLDIVELLLKMGARVCGKAMEEAVHQSHIDILDVLVQYGGVGVDDNIALREAAQQIDIDGIRFLLQAGADVHACDEEALFSAVSLNNVPAVQLLLKHGADVRARNDEALHLAALGGQRGMVEILLKAGADPHAWQTEAALAVRTNVHPDILRMLKEYRGWSRPTSEPSRRNI
ncbi:hypothetical protein HDV00_005134 [Rhizophlyctis rosea]|nr:hypothetical protein HDV00_005134 [Rhizophlyctis rosea]